MTSPPITVRVSVRRRSSRSVASTRTVSSTPPVPSNSSTRAFCCSRSSTTWAGLAWPPGCRASTTQRPGASASIRNRPSASVTAVRTRPVSAARTWTTASDAARRLPSRTRPTSDAVVLCAQTGPPLSQPTANRQPRPIRRVTREKFTIRYRPYFPSGPEPPAPRLRTRKNPSPVVSVWQVTRPGDATTAKFSNASGAPAASTS